MKEAILAGMLVSQLCACASEPTYVSPPGSPSGALRAKLAQNGAKVSGDFLRSYDRYELLASQPTPSSWTAGALWEFKVTSKAVFQKHITLQFRVTNQPARTCISGDWYSLEPLPGTETLVTRPAYSVSGRNLQILLSNALCDAYDEITGTLDSTGFVGRRRFSHMLGEEARGSVVGHMMSASSSEGDSPEMPSNNSFKVTRNGAPQFNR